MLAERGDLDELRARADAGDRFAALRLADLLAEQNDLDELRARADAGDGTAALRLADLLVARGDLDGAAQILRARADVGDRTAALRLADLLVARGDLDELRARADAGDRFAALRLADLLAEQDDLDEPPSAELGRLAVPRDLEPIPGQLALPGMPSRAGAAVGAADRQPTLPGLELPAAVGPRADDRKQIGRKQSDRELATVAAELTQAGR